MKLKTIILSALLLCGFSAIQAQTIEEAVAKFNEGKQQAAAKEFAKAIPIVEQALTMAETITDNEGAGALSEDIKKLIPQLYLMDGVTLFNSKKYTNAIDQLMKAEDMASKYGNADVRRNASRFVSTAYMAIGIESFNNKDFTKALEAFTKGYDQDPKNVKLALYTAKSYAEIKDLEAAAKLYQEIIAAGTENSKYAADAADAKNDINNYFLAAAAEAATAKDLDNTIKCVDQILAMDPTNDKAQLLVIQCANNLKKYDEVVARGAAAAEAQLTADAKSDIYLLLGVAYQNRGNNAKAIEFLKKVTAGSSVAQAQQLVKDLSAQAQ